MRLNLRAIDFSRFRIQDLQRPSRTVAFALNPPQRFALQKLIELQDQKKPLWTITLKARRVGFSTFFAILNSCHCIAMSNAIALTVAHRAKNAKAVFSAAQTAHRTILADVGLPFENYRTQHELRFPHAEGESVLTLATAKTVEGARGMTLTALQLSECAFYEQAEDALTALMSTVTYQPETMLNVETTANGKINNGEAFHDLWQDAVEGKNQFVPIFISWLMDPNCQMDPDQMNVRVTNLDSEEKELVKLHGATYPQLSWRRWAIPNKCQGYVDKFHQEYPHTPEVAFITSGDPAFNEDEMKAAEKSCYAPRFMGSIEQDNEVAA